MKCPQCEKETEPYWVDGYYGIGIKYYKCKGCGMHFDSKSIKRIRVVSENSNKFRIG